MAQRTSSAAGGSDPVCELVPMRTHVCLPGEPVLALGPTAVIATGSGLRVLPTAADKEVQPPQRQVLLAEYCAAVQRLPHPLHTHVNRYQLESPAARRYHYAAGDPLVAVVARKIANHYYHLYTGGPSLAHMDVLAFDGATRTSRPRLNEGDVVYCYVKKAKAANYLDGNSSSAGAGGGEVEAVGGEVELSCTAAEVGLPPKDWTSGEAVFGPLNGGRLLTLPLPYARSLLAAPPPPAASAAKDRKRARDGEGVGGAATTGEEAVPASYLLSALGARVPFEVCVGLNGLVWVRGQRSAADQAAAAQRTVAVAACISEAQYDVTRAEMDARVESYFPA